MFWWIVPPGDLVKPTCLGCDEKVFLLVLLVVVWERNNTKAREKGQKSLITISIVTLVGYIVDFRSA